ncbi:twitching motility protein PilT [Sphingomonas sp. Leaf357]|uniref:type II toxin-antitoxin system VapC family toxin n=1 Tax=Sphingomonas sp. Leaf357 TaxID=1736350 RepID=UPI0006FCF3C2|nr:type II toxin-antitoxin system VapC family toxin [Sphingomonas sp. Leaf357]KQS01378.1 twitching motility protein PilT [Sphingomonas sp. Leaf357]
MKFLLDSNTIIDLLIGTKPALFTRVTACEAGDLAVSTISLGQVIQNSVRRKAPLMEVLETFLREVALVEFDRDSALRYATLPFKRNSFDRLIAAHALSLGLTLVTNNVHDFADIAGLRVENWTV